jgi:hypothetical protein
MKDLARVGAVDDELGPCGLDVVDDEEQSVDRARRGGREALADVSILGIVTSAVGERPRTRA